MIDYQMYILDQIEMCERRLKSTVHLPHDESVREGRRYFNEMYGGPDAFPVSFHSTSAEPDVILKEGIKPGMDGWVSIAISPIEVLNTRPKGNTFIIDMSKVKYGTVNKGYFRLGDKLVPPGAILGYVSNEYYNKLIELGCDAKELNQKLKEYYVILTPRKKETPNDYMKRVRKELSGIKTLPGCPDPKVILTCIV